MLHGALTPPYCPALPAQMLGSISLCGGARSNCAHPQNMSLGKNIRSSDCEIETAEFCVPELCELPAGGALCAPHNVRVNRGNTRIHSDVFIPPPVSAALSKTSLSPCTLPPSAFWKTRQRAQGAGHCNLSQQKPGDLSDPT